MESRATTTSWQGKKMSMRFTYIKVHLYRKLGSGIATDADTPEKYQFCIDARIIYKNHLESG